MKKIFFGTLLALLFFSANSAMAVEAHYQVGVELKPLPILLTTVNGGQGAGVGFELSSSRYGNWVFLGNIEYFQGDRQDQQFVPQKLTDQSVPITETDYEFRQAGFGLRNYSNRQDDSYYFGTEIALANEIQNFEIGFERFKVIAQNIRPSLDLGYRWIWDSGTMVRAGVKGVFVTNSTNRFSGEKEDLPEEWREAFFKSFEDGEKSTDFFATMDFGLGYTF